MAIKNPKNNSVSPPAIKGIRTEVEAFKYIFEHSNQAGADIMGCEISKFVQYRHSFNHGKLGAMGKQILTNGFGFDPYYKLKK